MYECNTRYIHVGVTTIPVNYFKIYLLLSTQSCLHRRLFAVIKGVIFAVENDAIKMAVSRRDRVPKDCET